MNYIIDLIESFVLSYSFNLATDVIMCTLSVFLTYSLYKLMEVLKNNLNHHSFGSDEWFSWIRDTISVSTCTIGTIGLSVVTFMHSMSQDHAEEITETLADVFVIFILLATISFIRVITNNRVILCKTNLT